MQFPSFQFPWKKNKDQQCAVAQQSSAQLRKELEVVQQSCDGERAAMEAAKLRFDESGDDDDVKALNDAQARLQHAELHVSRLERLIRRAEQRETDESQRAHAEAVALAHANFLKGMAEDEELVRQEVHLLKQLVDLRVMRCRVRERAHEYLSPYGGVRNDVHNDHLERTPDSHRVRRALEGVMDGDPRSTMIMGVLPEPEEYHVMHPYFGLGRSERVDWNNLEPLVSKKPKPPANPAKTSLGVLSASSQLEVLREPTLTTARRALVEDGEVREPKGGPVRLVGLDRGAVLRDAPPHPGPIGGYVTEGSQVTGGPVLLGREREAG